MSLKGGEAVDAEFLEATRARKFTPERHPDPVSRERHEAHVNALAEAANLTESQREQAIDHAGSGLIKPQGKTREEQAQYISGSAHHAERLKLGRPRIESWTSAAGKFLKAHPEYSGNRVIRQTLAINLFILGEESESWDEVRQLAKQDGKEAVEARTLMKARNISAEPPKPWWKIW